MSVENLKAAIRDVPDFPKEGILFKDIAPILSNPGLFKQAIDLFAKRHQGADFDKIAVIESRGFLFGAALADRLDIGMALIRKAGKLPYKTVSETYDLEYGTATVEMHVDAVSQGDRVLVIDDLLATGGTASAAAKLIEKQAGVIVEIDFLIELAFLNGRNALSAYEIYAPLVF